MLLTWLVQLCCNHDFHTQPKRTETRWEYPCFHKCGKVKKGPLFEYESTNIVAEREAGR